ncbi:hypothetical protein LSH36_350g04041 [Paralvinella palmiformis]|uniref:Uncharacterized protein n=1 Tax=Paralvinella palmiformis TaxID=53620 RepID=A0AAD9N038_9ANNE|nr:hypothetical protein LSH36_350g04041 [Paralvinella palmiformis]
MLFLGDSTSPVLLLSPDSIYPASYSDPETAIPVRRGHQPEAVLWTSRCTPILRSIIPDETSLLIKYIDTTYISRELHHHRDNRVPQPDVVIPSVRFGRSPPFFPPIQWNMHRVTLDTHPRTNYVCEGWKNTFGHSNPSIKKLIGYLQENEEGIGRTPDYPASYLPRLV